MVKLKQFLLTLFFTGLFIWGGLGFDQQLTVLFGAVASVFFLIGFVLYGKKVHLPLGFGWLCGFVGILLVGVWWSHNRIQSLQYLLLLASGIPFLIGASTLRSTGWFRDTIQRSIISTGVIFTFLWVVQVFIRGEFTILRPFSLFTEFTYYKNHNHLGDWWMMMSILLVGKKQFAPWILPSMVMLWASRSRSAIVGLVAGFGYYGWNEGWWKHRRTRLVLISIVVSGFIWLVGTQKATLNSRDYYIQALAGLIRYPFGVGLGNFEVISGDTSMHWWGRSHFSTVVHNLAIEWISAVGVLAVVGLMWLGLVAWKLGLSTEGKERVWRGVYWSLFINFMLDSTYFLPSMWWVFMIVVGLSESEE